MSRHWNFNVLCFHILWIFIFTVWWSLASECHIYTVLCLNTLAEFRTPREAFSHPALMGNGPTCNRRSYPYQPSEWFTGSLSQVECLACHAVATRKVPHEKNVDLKSMQVNILKCVKRMERRGGGIRTD